MRCACPPPRPPRRSHYLLEVGLAGRSQLDLACAPQEEGDGELALELADLLRRRRLCDVQPFALTT